MAAAQCARHVIWYVKRAASKAGIAGLPILPENHAGFCFREIFLGGEHGYELGMAVWATSGYSLKTQNAMEGWLRRYAGSSLECMNRWRESSQLMGLSVGGLVVGRLLLAKPLEQKRELVGADADMTGGMRVLASSAAGRLSLRARTSQ